MAISLDGKQIFIADFENNRIRVVHLDQSNDVTTLVGDDSPGKQDGPLKSSRFNHPQSVAYLPQEMLVVNDYGNQLLRLVDLKNGKVSTIVGNAPTTLEEGPASQISAEGIRDIVYMPASDSLFFTQPDKGTLKRLDLKTMRIVLVPTNKQDLPHPSALCASGNELYVADRDLPPVFRMEWKEGTAPNLESIVFSDGFGENWQISLRHPVQRTGSLETPFTRYGAGYISVRLGG